MEHSSRTATLGPPAPSNQPFSEPTPSLHCYRELEDSSDNRAVVNLETGKRWKDSGSRGVGVGVGEQQCPKQLEEPNRDRVGRE